MGVEGAGDPKGAFEADLVITVAGVVVVVIGALIAIARIHIRTSTA